jgi:hypothetical protein
MPRNIISHKNHDHHHPAIVGPDGTWKGLTWRDMPGVTDDVRRLNFALYRRGLHSGVKDRVTVERAANARRIKALKRREHKRSN